MAFIISASVATKRAFDKASSFILFIEKSTTFTSVIKLFDVSETTLPIKIVEKANVTMVDKMKVVPIKIIMILSLIRSLIYCQIQTPNETAPANSIILLNMYIKLIRSVPLINISRKYAIPNNKNPMANGIHVGLYSLFHCLNAKYAIAKNKIVEITESCCTYNVKAGIITTL